MQESHPIKDNSLWTYKDKLYRVNAVLPNNMIQFGDKWCPTVRYTLEPANGMTFYRADEEFMQKFEPYGMAQAA